ncbi:MAG: glycosyl hydrolase 53 family protein [Clostridiales bacterium]|nr:glycosyl hydrolase 53 family protein [Clostridiales bacterium]
MKKRVLCLFLTGMLTLGLVACSTESDTEINESESAAGTENSASGEASENGGSEETEETETTEAAVADITALVKDWSQEYDEDVYVAAVDGLSDDFIMGMDISSLLVEEASGVVYYNEDGEEEDLLKILADAGINYVRVRVWADPYDEDGNGYGGGNCDAQTAAEIGARAAEYGIKLCVDFHYSDFWADPNKQFCPKAWEGMTVDEKADALAEYTAESLNTIIEAGADVGMVQIGNEINYGLAGETTTENIMALLAAGSEAVRSVDSDIMIVVHYTQLDSPSDVLEHAQNLSDYGVDYDVFGASYYTYWHGTLENMQEVLSEIESTYGVKTCIMETAARYTDEDGASSGNSVSGDDTWEEYPATVQGQASCIRDVIEAASNAGSIGVFYWEGAWVPVGSDYETNSPVWEEYGSGWASSYAAEYDPDDAGVYYGGSSWDNQALFDFSGKALASLNVFNYVYTGHEIELKALAYKSVEIEVELGGTITMPDTVEVVWNDSTNSDGMAVTWDESEVDKIDVSSPGSYAIDGTLEDGTAITARVDVAAVNLLENADFEDADTSMWEVEYLTSDTSQTDIQTKESDALSGENAFHFWSAGDVGFTVEQTVTATSSGTYIAESNIQGGDMGSDSEIYLYVEVNGERVAQSDNIALQGWCEWIVTDLEDIDVNEGDVVTVGMYVTGAAGGWGTMDDWMLYCQG